VTPKHRREMLLALVDLYGSALPEGSPEWEKLADQWDDANANISGAKVNEDRLAQMVIATMTWAAGAIRRSGCHLMVRPCLSCGALS
jgi:hypothetical protein